MNISINEYNTVINGLRQQFELQRNLTRESNQRADAILGTFKAVQEENAGLKDGLRMVLDINREYREDLCACLSAAEGIEAGCKTVEAQAIRGAIGRLIEDKNSLCADMHLVLAVAKGGKVAHEPTHECARQALNAIARKRSRK